MRTERKRILWTTNTLDILQEHEVLNFISVPAGATLMTVIFWEEDSEKLKLEGILSGIDYGVYQLPSCGPIHIAHVQFVFVLPLDLGRGQALKRRCLHLRHTNSSERILFSGFKGSKVVIRDLELLKPASMHSRCILKHCQGPSALWRANNYRATALPDQQLPSIANVSTKTRSQ